MIFLPYTADDSKKPMKFEKKKEIKIDQNNFIFLKTIQKNNKKKSLFFMKKEKLSSLHFQFFIFQFFSNSFPKFVKTLWSFITTKPCSLLENFITTKPWV